MNIFLRKAMGSALQNKRQAKGLVPFNHLPVNTTCFLIDKNFRCRDPRFLELSLLQYFCNGANISQSSNYLVKMPTASSIVIPDWIRES